MNFVWIERGESLAMYQPWSYTKDWFGTLAFWAFPTTMRQREWSLYFDGANSETKTIKTSWALCKFASLFFMEGKRIEKLIYNNSYQD